jgi:hypothetical protein
VTLLRQIEVGIATGKPTPQACNEAEITVQTYYRWRKQYGGLKLEQAKRMKELEQGEHAPEAVGGGTSAGEAGIEERSLGKLLSPERRRCAVERAREQYGMTERHACRLLEVIDTLADVMLGGGIPEHIRSDNGPEFIAYELREWLAKVGTRTLYIEHGGPWENGYCESFNGKLRDEWLNGGNLLLAEGGKRSHSALGYRPPAPVAACRPGAISISHQQL